MTSAITSAPVATTVGSASGTLPTQSRRPRRRPALLTPAGLGLLPFAAWVLLFLAVPTLLALATGFVDGDGKLSTTNLEALADPFVLGGFGASFGISAVTALVGVIVGGLVCYALLGANPEGALRSTVDAISGVLAQFGGVMLAFAFVATIGIQGFATIWLEDSLGIDIFTDGVWLYEVPGLILPYIYFQVPLMVITYLPALEGLKPQWAEANATLGGTARVYWIRIALPVLAPSLLGSFLLLFANSFSSYATAAALTSQGAGIVPLQIRAALTSETLLGRENLAGALALGMIVVMAVVMMLYALLQRRAARWQR